jgi:hypothetical protein
MSGPTRDDWLRALGDAVKPIDPTALTLAEIAEQFGIGRYAAENRIRKLLKERKATLVYKMVTDASGRTQARQAYRLVKRPAGKRQ